MLDYEKLQPSPPNTRSSASSSCPCTVCTIAGLKEVEYREYVKDHSNKAGRPTVDKESESTIKETLTLCSSCLSEICQGKNHVCKKSQKRENLASLIGNSSEGSKSSVLASSLKDLAQCQGENTRGGVVGLQSGSKVLPVQIGTSRSRQGNNKFSHEDITNLGKRLNLSNTSIM